MKFILGDNLDAMIFALFNPEYKIIQHQDLQTNFEKAPNPAIFNTVVRLFANDWNSKLLEKLNIASQVEDLEFSFDIGTRDQAIKKKLTRWDNLVDLSMPIFTDHNKVNKIGKTDSNKAPIFTVPVSALKMAIKDELGPGRFLDANKFGRIYFISGREICFAKESIYFESMISTIDPVIFSSFSKDCNFATRKSLPTSLFLFESDEDLDPWIRYINCPMPFNRITHSGKYFVVDVTGIIGLDEIKPFFRQYKFLDKMVIEPGKIRKEFYNQYPKNIIPLGRFADSDPDHRIEDTVKVAIHPEYLLFKKIWESQKKINSHYQESPYTIDKKEHQTKEFVLRMFHQSTKLLDTVNWKKNKPQKQLDYEDIVSEWFDMFRYWLSIGVTWEIDYKDFLERIEHDFQKYH